MSSRAIVATAWSLMSLCIVAFSGYFVSRDYFVSHDFRWRRSLALVAISAVYLWLAWFLITRYRRYDSRPFQIKHTFRMRISNQEENLGPIVIDGPALLILNSDVQTTRFSLNISEPADAEKPKKYGFFNYSETDFLIQQTGRWSANLAARQLGRIRKAQRGGWASITLEVRGHCQVHELPSSAQEGFPVITRASDQPDSHHL